MQKERYFGSTFFAAETLELALDAIDAAIAEAAVTDVRHSWTVNVGEASWTYDSREEFIADYRRGTTGAFAQTNGGHYMLRFQVIGTTSRVAVEAPTRVTIERVFAPFEASAETSRIPEPPPTPPRVFVGHGRSAAWRDLKDHLQDQHGYAIEAYEIGARAGHAIRDILEDMLSRSAFALLVLTAEDETASGLQRARQNVVHELGLFQGHLGFARAVVLLEEGVELFSNLEGIQQIRFRSGAIRETFGDVLATLRREFGGVAP